MELSAFLEGIMLPKKNNDFYIDVDKERYDTHRTMIFLVILFCVIVIAGSFASVWLVGKLRHQVTNNSLNNNLGLTDLKSQLLSFFPGGNLANNDLTVTLTDDQLSSLLNATDAGSGKQTLQNLIAIINTKDILIKGELTSPISSHITINVSPKISQGKIVLTITRAKLGPLNLPGVLKNSLTPALNKIVSNNLNRDSVYYESVKLDNHLITIKGRAK
jgi:hypothetical protein